MNKYIHFLLTGFVFFLALTSFQNCGNFLLPQHDQSSISVNPAEASFFANKIQPLTQKCAGCHGNGQNPQFVIVDPAAELVFCETTMSLGQYLCNKSAPAQSRWVTKLAGGHSGFGATDSQAFQTAIQNWTTAYPP